MIHDLPPYVERTASIERAIREASEFKKRRDVVAHIVNATGEIGMTWRELGKTLGLHHGQISAVLSKLHDDGILVALAKIRDGSHPYISAAYAYLFDESELVRRPAITKARRYRDLRSAAGELIRTLDSSTCPCKSNTQIEQIEKVRMILDDLAE